MLDPLAQFIDLDPRSWRNLWRIFRVTQPERAIFVRHNSGSLEVAYDSRVGLRQDIQMDFSDPIAAAEELIKSHPQVDRVYIYERSGVERFISDIRSPEYDALDLDEYRFKVRQLLRRKYAQAIVVRPPIEDWYETSYDGLRAIVARAGTAPSIILVGIYEGEQEYASLLLWVEGAKIKRFSTFEALTVAGLPRPQNLDEVSAALDKVEKSLGRIGLAVLTDPPTAREVMKSADPSGAIREALQKGKARVPRGAELL